MNVEDYVKGRVRDGCVNLMDLVDEVSRRFNMGRLEAAYEVYRLWKMGVIDIDYPYDTALPYFFTIDGLWYWAILAITGIAITSVVLIRGGPLIYIRYALGALFVLFLPGYTLVEALYPRGDELMPLERLALSIGLSLAIVPLIGLLLNYTPWGIRLTPIVTSTAILVILLATVAAIRKARLLSISHKCAS